ncbi:thy-1 membrane glycoprotein-like [Triplophysa rosa]|uniref:Thy-1 membrane glycoprotein-like n=1 Tax=Triplophysa rosa TaxID=992332 RepID=A0A9W7WFS5_TRIRA|nr:thy-1 membrane glycoprotein-like [Triplophysa rosa]XP_057215483.1 thy-1 membrane glycoprotein-like [Triplophysa rosa]KAI7796068.1 putative thy-1 membrane glycoprotein-like [Triplophysa rosa]
MNTSNSIFVWIVFLEVLISTVLCQGEESIITVCQEEDTDLRVNCLLEPKANYHTDFEFSMSKGNKEMIINTNISGIMPEPKFRHNTFVTEIEPYGFRLTMMGFTITENTTFICKVTKTQKTLFVELDTIEPCSAISVFLLGYPWISLLIPLCIMWEDF